MHSLNASTSNLIQNQFNKPTRFLVIVKTMLQLCRYISCLDHFVHQNDYCSREDAQWAENTQRINLHTQEQILQNRRDYHVRGFGNIHLFKRRNVKLVRCTNSKMYMKFFLCLFFFISKVHDMRWTNLNLVFDWKDSLSFGI